MNPGSASGHFSPSPVSELFGLHLLGRAKAGPGGPSQDLVQSLKLNLMLVIVMGFQFPPLTIKQWDAFHLRDFPVLTLGDDSAGK